MEKEDKNRGGGGGGGGYMLWITIQLNTSRLGKVASIH